MAKIDVKRFLKDCPNKSFVKFILEKVNLSELELKVIDYKINKNISNEKLSENLDMSIEYTNRLVRATFDKIANNWRDIFYYIRNFK